MGNEIADAAAQTSLKHDIPQFLDIRKKIIDSQERIKKKWENIPAAVCRFHNFC